MDASYFDARYKPHPGRTRVWKAIAEYLQEFVPASSRVADVGAGYCDFINQIGMMVAGAVKPQLAGPVGIVKITGEVAATVPDLGWWPILSLTAILGGRPQTPRRAARSRSHPLPRRASTRCAYSRTTATAAWPSRPRLR